MNVIKKYWVLDNYISNLFKNKDNVIIFNSKNSELKLKQNKLDNNLFARSIYTIGIKDSINKKVEKQFIYSSYFTNVMSGYISIIECKLEDLKNITEIENSILCIYSNSILTLDKLLELAKKDINTNGLVSSFSSFININSYNKLNIKTISLFNNIKDNKE